MHRCRSGVRVLVCVMCCKHKGKGVCSCTWLRMFLFTTLWPSMFHSRMVLSEEQDRKDPGVRCTFSPPPHPLPPPPSGFTCRRHKGCSPLNALFVSLFPLPRTDTVQSGLSNRNQSQQVYQCSHFSTCQSSSQREAPPTKSESVANGLNCVR